MVNINNDNGLSDKYIIEFMVNINNMFNHQ